MSKPYLTLTVMALACVEISEPVAQAQVPASPLAAVQAPAAPQPAARRRAHKVPNLELDTRGTGEPPEATGPNTSTSDVGTGDRSGSDGASASTLPPPPFEAPAPTPPGASPPPLQPGGVTPSSTPDPR